MGPAYVAGRRLHHATVVVNPTSSRLSADLSGTSSGAGRSDVISITRVPNSAAMGEGPANGRFVGRLRVCRPGRYKLSVHSPSSSVQRWPGSLQVRRSHLRC